MLSHVLHYTREIKSQAMEMSANTPFQTLVYYMVEEMYNIIIYREHWYIYLCGTF